MHLLVMFQTHRSPALDCKYNPYHYNKYCFSYGSEPQHLDVVAAHITVEQIHPHTTCGPLTMSTIMTKIMLKLFPQLSTLGCSRAHITLEQIHPHPIHGPLPISITSKIMFQVISSPSLGFML